MTPKDPRRHVFRYDSHMPEVDDLALIVLKGHLLVEEMLRELADLASAHPEHLQTAQLGFSKLANIVRAIVPWRSDDECWSLILGLNKLRNMLAHQLEPQDLRNAIDSVLKRDKCAQPFTEIVIDKSEETFDPAEGIRQAVVTCMQFHCALIFEYEEGVDSREPRDGGNLPFPEERTQDDQD